MVRARYVLSALLCAVLTAGLGVTAFGVQAASASSAVGFNHSSFSDADVVRMQALIGYPGWVRFAVEYDPRLVSGPDPTQPKRPAYQWEFDRELYIAKAHGFKVLVTGLGNFSPGCTTTPSTCQYIGRHAMPQVGDTTAQNNYIAYMRYLLAPAVDAVSPWNEPNNDIFGGGGATGDPNKITYACIKNVWGAAPCWQQDSALQADVVWAAALNGWTRTVFSSGLSPWGDANNAADPQVPLHWWANLLNNDPSWVDRFSVLDAHAYGWSNNGTILTTNYRYNPALQQADIQALIAGGGHGTKQLAWTEYGAPSGGNTSDPCTLAYRASQQTQYNNYVDANALWQWWEGSGKALWGKLAHKDNDDSETKCSGSSPLNFGLTDANGNIRLAAGPFQTEAARVR